MSFHSYELMLNSDVTTLIHINQNYFLTRACTTKEQSKFSILNCLKVCFMLKTNSCLLIIAFFLQIHRQLKITKKILV